MSDMNTIDILHKWEKYFNNHSKGKVCPYCGQSSQTVFVHGHEQCVVCKTNVEPCCSGEFPKST